MNEWVVLYDITFFTFTSWRQVGEGRGVANLIYNNII